jgi:hypothetical protein
MVIETFGVWGRKKVTMPFDSIHRTTFMLIGKTDGNRRVNKTQRKI